MNNVGVGARVMVHAYPCYEGYIVAFATLNYPDGARSPYPAAVIQKEEDGTFDTRHVCNLIVIKEPHEETK